MVKVNVRETSYYMNEKIKDKWDNLKDGKLTKNDEDRVYVVDGRERTGKSLFAIQQAAYIDPTILDDENGKLLPRITYTARETLNAIRHTKSNDKETKVIIFDEAFRGMSSKGALSKENKLLTTAMMEMGQNNIVLFIVSPSFFLLELYPAVLRSNALFHIVKQKKSKRRFFRLFNYRKKAVLYQRGIRKGWGYSIHTMMKDWFFNKYPMGDEFEQRYRKKKYDSLKQITKDEEQKPDSKFMLQRDILIRNLYENSINSHRKLSEYLKGIGIFISATQIGVICKQNAVNAVVNAEN